MPYKDYKIEKLYYTITEVAEMLDIPSSTIRFWEKEFKELHPKRDSKGSRKYTPKDIEIIGRINYLVKEHGFTIEGARGRLKENEEQELDTIDLAQRLESIKGFLLNFKSNIDKL